jgi:hypothetical protein
MFSGVQWKKRDLGNFNLVKYSLWKQDDNLWNYFVST